MQVQKQASSKLKRKGESARYFLLVLQGIIGFSFSFVGIMTEFALQAKAG